MNLDGNEIEGQLGTNGGYSLDVDATGKVTIALSYMAGEAKASIMVEADIIEILQKLADKTGTNWDNRALDMIKLSLGR